jgi:ABC-type lipoprotein release transport system permease subunit
MVFHQTLRLILAGLGIGLVCGILVGRVLAGMPQMLYGVHPAEPVTFVTVALLLFAVALGACFLPARRAMQTDPMVVLRHE